MKPFRDMTPEERARLADALDAWSEREDDDGGAEFGAHWDGRPGRCLVCLALGTLLVLAVGCLAWRAWPW